MRAVQKVSAHFEYLENRSRWLDVTWQPVRGDLTVHSWTLSRGTSQSAVRRRWLNLCTVWPLHSHICFLPTAILALGKAGSPREPNLCCRGWQSWVMRGFAKKKKVCTRVVQWAGSLSDLLARSLWMRPSHCTQAHSTVPHCLLTSPMGEWLFTDAQQDLLWLAAKLHLQRCLTADWLARRESDSSRMHSKMSYDWLPSYIFNGVSLPTG